MSIQSRFWDSISDTRWCPVLLMPDDV